MPIQHTKTALILKVLVHGPKTRYEIIEIFGSSEIANILSTFLQRGFATATSENHTDATNRHRIVRRYALSDDGRESLAKYEAENGVVKHPALDKLFANPKSTEAKHSVIDLDKKTSEMYASNNNLFLYMAVKAIGKMGFASRYLLECTLRRKLTAEEYNALTTGIVSMMCEKDGMLSLTKLGQTALENYEAENGPIQLPGPVEIMPEMASALNLLQHSSRTQKCSASGLGLAWVDVWGEAVRQFPPLASVTRTGGDAVYDITSFGSEALDFWKQCNPNHLSLLEPSEKPAEYPPTVSEHKPAEAPVGRTVIEVDPRFFESMNLLTDRIGQLAEGFVSINDYVARAMRLAEVAFKTAEETATRLDLGNIETRALKVVEDLEKMHKTYASNLEECSKAGSIRHLLEEAKINLGEIETLKALSIESKESVDKIREDAGVKFSQLQSLVDRTNNSTNQQGPGETIDNTKRAERERKPKILIVGLKPIQSGTIANEYSDKFEISCWNSGDGTNKVKPATNGCDMVFVHVAHIGHEVSTAIESCGAPFTNVPGGLSGMRVALNEFAKKQA